MGKRIPQVDAYIAKSAPFARPILEKVRRLFHEGCPGLEEKIKWGMPSFEYQGMLGGMAAFKAHATFGFWRQKEIPDPERLLKTKSPMGAGKFADVSELPSDEVLLRYVRRAAELNESGVKAPRPKPKPKAALKAPPWFTAALKKSPKAKATFDGFPPSHQREYLEWLVEAKQEETRQRRLAQAIEWMEEGKPRNWKYMKKR